MNFDSAADTATLQQCLTEISEECENWRVRCLRAEAEVRALKRSAKTAGVSNLRPLEVYTGFECGSQAGSASAWEAQSISQPHSPGISASEAQVRELRATLQSEALSVTHLHDELGAQKRKLEACQEELEHASQQRQQLLREPLSLSGSLSDSNLPEGDDLRLQLRHKNEAIMQLQADMVREKQQIDRHRREAETKSVLCQEELFEMTERAKSLSEQVKTSRKKASELQAAREEIGTLRSEIEDLSKRCNEVSGLRTELGASVGEREALKSELTSAKPKLDEHASLETALEQRERALSCLEESSAQAASDSESKQADENGWQSRQQKVLQGVSSIRQLCSEMQKEMRTDRTRPPERLSASRRASGGSAPDKSPAGSEKMMTRLSKQLERLQQIVEVQQKQPQGTRRTLSPEGEHPPPEDNRKLNLQLNVDAAGNLQQQINEYRLAAEKTREDMMSEHYEELDDLVGRFSKERLELHSEIRELHEEYARAEAGGGSEGPMSEIRAHFENQVAVMKRELVAQLSDVHERQRSQRDVDEQELKQLQKSLEQCQQDLASSQEEFAILSTLFDKERRDGLALKLRLETTERDRDDTRNAVAGSAASSGPAPVPTPAPAASPAPPVLPPQAVIATVGAVTNIAMPSCDMTPETTGTWDFQMLQGLAHIQAPEPEKPIPKVVSGSIPADSPIATPTNPTGGTPSVGGASMNEAAAQAPPVSATASSGHASPQQSSPRTVVPRSPQQTSRARPISMPAAVSAAMPHSCYAPAAMPLHPQYPAPVNSSSSIPVAAVAVSSAAAGPSPLSSLSMTAGPSPLSSGSQLRMQQTSTSYVPLKP